MTSPAARKGSRAFNEHYAAIYGSRWPALREALLRDRDPVGVEAGLERPYYLDAASLLVADLLGASPGEEVLDMCAAPGGKSLILALKLADQGRLTANERSRARRERLHRVLREHLGGERADRIRITGHDATRWGLHEQDAYDRILLDAPCSSERHLLAHPELLCEWSRTRSGRLATQQAAMLFSALEAVKRGGIILYSTCSISPAENEGVVRKVLDRRPGRLEELDLSFGFPALERVGPGFRILPDSAQGAGPMYFSLLIRRS